MQDLKKIIIFYGLQDRQLQDRQLQDRQLQDRQSQDRQSQDRQFIRPTNYSEKDFHDLT